MILEIGAGQSMREFVVIQLQMLVLMYRFIDRYYIRNRCRTVNKRVCSNTTSNASSDVQVER